MSIFIAVPYDFGTNTLSDTQQTEQTEALAEMQLLIDGGYEPMRATLRYTDTGTYRVFEMERFQSPAEDTFPVYTATPTELDPQTAAAR